MNKSIILLILVIVTAFCSHAQSSVQPRKYKGSTLSATDLKATKKAEHIGLLSATDNLPEVRYAWFYEGDEIVLLIMKEKTKEVYDVKDELHLPSEKRQLALSFFLCRQDGNDQSNLFGLINTSDNDDFDSIKVKRAWVIIQDKMRIKEVPANNVTCQPNASEEIVR